ncbi:hypothetical protein UFOVP276_25 [uncultured Caudovirales phage]|uniref:Uncharacterized protein n=1 Tax=uncultured Caudovirales phage TaxID=2100421 RepID=A0A6J5LEM7_9CAUD|nr:hypothetical protein UFOVP127_162 [uncultured Caudovirales phage]CAB4134881.1 hypothetical protein UFOVP276_25 [uncultured Caudovirales phage]
MAIATLTRREQELIKKHGHVSHLEVAIYRAPKSRKIDSMSVECTKCGEVLVELIGGREQESPQANTYYCTNCADKLNGIVYAIHGSFHCESCFEVICG